jgi:hypothetical protein
MYLSTLEDVLADAHEPPVLMMQLPAALRGLSVGFNSIQCTPGASASVLATVRALAALHTTSIAS